MDKDRYWFKKTKIMTSIPVTWKGYLFMILSPIVIAFSILFLKSNQYVLGSVVFLEIVAIIIIVNLKTEV